jgi:hypothetical protein
VRWVVGEDSNRALGRRIEMRISTLVLSALALAIVLGLVGMWLRTDRRGEGLHERLLDEQEERARLAALQGVGFDAPDSGGRALEPARKPPEFRSVAGGGASGGAGGESARGGATGEPAAAQPPIPAELATANTRWLRVRAQMDQKECVELLDHLARLRTDIEERNGCADNSIACKRFETEVDGDGAGARYAVDIGPFPSWRMAQEAAAELRRLTSRGAWRFKEDEGYFEKAYPYKRTRS